MRVRLLGIDAPERDQGSAGHQATEYLEPLAPPGQKLRLEFNRMRRDRYERLLAYAWLPDGRMVNEEMVRGGYAVAFLLAPKHKHRRRIEAAQNDARRRGAGLWRDGALSCPPVAFRYRKCR